MKILLAFLFVGLVAAETSEFFARVKRDANPEKTCTLKANECCNNINADCKSQCSSLILDKSKYDDFAAFANENLAKSFEYLFLSAQFGTFSKDRPGFKKVFDGLADKAWNNGIEMIKEASKRGVTHDFSKSSGDSSPTVTISENVEEINAMGMAVEIEKNLLKKANKVHRHHSHASTADAEATKKGYDAGLSHYIEEEIIEGKTETVRNLVGHVNDLMKLLDNNQNFPLSLYLFDQYLQK